MKWIPALAPTQENGALNVPRGTLKSAPPNMTLHHSNDVSRETTTEEQCYLVRQGCAGPYLMSMADRYMFHVKHWNLSMDIPVVQSQRDSVPIADSHEVHIGLADTHLRISTGHHVFHVKHETWADADIFRLGCCIPVAFSSRLTGVTANPAAVKHVSRETSPCIYNEHRTLSYLLPIMDYPANSMSSLSVAVTPAPRRRWRLRAPVHRRCC